MYEYFVGHIINPYLPYFIASCLQGLFLALPVSFKDWHDDLLNVICYSSFQSFVAAILFLAIPFFIGGSLPSVLAGCCAVSVVFLASWFRATKLIPLEASHFFRTQPSHKIKINFDDFLISENYEVLRNVNKNLVGGEQRYRFMRERLLRVKKESIGYEDL
jgi:hypothetical protein